MLFSSCGFISLDNLIPFRVLAWEQSLKDKPLDAKSLESTHSKGHIWIPGVWIWSREHSRSVGQPPCIIHVLGWPLSELKRSPWMIPLIYSNRIIVVWLFCLIFQGKYFFSNELQRWCHLRVIITWDFRRYCLRLPLTWLSSLSLPTVPCVRGDRPVTFRCFSAYVLTLIFQMCSCVHLHFMEEQKSGSWALQQGKRLPLCL